MAKNIGNHKGKGGFRDHPENINKLGRPPLSLNKEVRELLQESVSNTDSRSKLEIILKMLFSKAVRGDIRAAAELLDRGWGKAPVSMIFSQPERIKMSFTDEDPTEESRIDEITGEQIVVLK